MKRRRPSTSTIPGSDLPRVLMGLAGLAMLGLAAGGAAAAFRLDGSAVGTASLSETPVEVQGDLHVAGLAPHRNLPVPEAAGGSTAQAPLAGWPMPERAEVSGRRPDSVAASDEEASRIAAAAANAEPVRPVRGQPASARLAADPAPAPSGPAAASPGAVPQPGQARHDIAPHRLEPGAVQPFQLASLFLRPGTGNDDRLWRRADDLLEAFGNVGYDLRRIRAGELEVPRIFVTALPEDMRTIRLAEQRKRTFIKVVLPLVLRANQAVLADRRRLKALLGRLADGYELSPEQSAWISELADRYGGTAGNHADLLKRVDSVPVSLALAQAAEESGWGTSRFARQGNAVFGQWTWDPEIGIVPRDRPRGRSHLVRTFPALQHSVAAYLANLNSNPAYAAFRTARAKQRAGGERLDGAALADHLTAYSGRGEAYVRTLRTIMRHNDLNELDTARLSDGVPGWTARLAGGVLRSVF